MSALHPRERAHGRPPDTVPGSRPASSRTIILLRAIGDSVNAFAPLRSVAQGALRILDLHDKVNSNREDCQRLAGRVASVVEALINQVGEATDVPLELKDRIDVLARTLHDISNFMNDLRNRPALARAVHSESDRASIQQLNKALDESIQTFLFTSSIHQALIQNDAERVGHGRHAVLLAGNGVLQDHLNMLMERLAETELEVRGLRHHNEVAFRKLEAYLRLILISFFKLTLDYRYIIMCRGGPFSGCSDTPTPGLSVVL